jgi:dihydroxyacetone kinase-like protein
MVDAMLPAARALELSAAQQRELGSAVREAAAAARAGAESTAPMRARRGRASYVGEVARGVLDPGAVTIAVFFETYPNHV